jgi:hypothetical protein
MSYNTEHINIVLGHMLRDVSFLQRAVHLTSDMVKNPAMGGTRAQALIFTLIKRYYREYDTVPDAQVVRAEVRSLLAKVQHKEMELIIEQVEATLAIALVVTAASAPLADAVVQEIARVCITLPSFEKALTEAKVSKSVGDLSVKLKELEVASQLFNPSVAEADLFGSSAPPVARVSTMIPWLDARFGGGAGLPRGLGVGIIAPQTAGKTTLGIMLAVAQALSGRGAHLALFEEGLTTSVKAKICACATGIPWPQIAAKYEELGDIDAAVIALGIDQGIPAEMIRMKLQLLKDNLKVTDGIASPEVGLEEMFIQNKKYLDRGLDMSYLYIDWAGILADSMLHMKKYSKLNLEQMLKHISIRVAQHAEETGTIVAISQQMSVADVKRGPFATHNMYCASDCKMFTAPLKYAFAINERDKKNNLSLFQTIKTRDDAYPSPLVLEMQGAIATFRDVSDSWALDRKRFVQRANRATVANAIPQE